MKIYHIISIFIWIVLSFELYLFLSFYPMRFISWPELRNLYKLTKSMSSHYIFNIKEPSIGVLSFQMREIMEMKTKPEAQSNILVKYFLKLDKSSRQHLYLPWLRFIEFTKLKPLSWQPALTSILATNKIKRGRCTTPPWIHSGGC